MPYRAEIRTSHSGQEAARSTDRLTIRHHRSGTAELAFEQATGGHLLHLALAGCVFNNVIRLAGDRGVRLDDAAVDVDGDFTDDGESTGIAVEIRLASEAGAEELARLKRDAFDVSTVVHVLRKATSVELKGA